MCISNTRKYYPSSKQFREPPTYTHQPSVQQKVPFSLIRCSSSKAAFCSCVEWGWRIYNIVESESDPLTVDPLTFSKKNPSRAIPRSTYIHPPSLAKIRQRTSEEIGNKQTDKHCSNCSMITQNVMNGLQWHFMEWVGGGVRGRGRGGGGGGKRNQWLDFGSNLDHHHADCPIANLAITRQLMSGFWWKSQVEVCTFWVHLLILVDTSWY